jgi:diguanylate cyclase (GGDEF)-like protein
MNRRLTRKHARELEAIEQAFMRSPSALVVTDGHRRIVAANPAYERLRGPQAAAYASCSATPWPELAQPDRGRRPLPWRRPPVVGLRRQAAAGGLALHVARACPGGSEGCGCAGWRHLAEHDALTGLPNRAQLESELGRALARATRRRQRLAMLFVDLDGFKQVNDGRGHASGDGLLRAIAARMRETLRGEDLLARYGGDEFVVLIEAPRQAADAAVAAMALLGAVKDAAVDHDADTPRVTASVGIALFPEHAADAARLLGVADAAMYSAKRSGGDAFAFADAHEFARPRLG